MTLKVAIVGYEYDEESPLDSYKGAVCRVIGEDNFTVHSKDPEGDLLKVLQHAHEKGYLVYLSSTIENYEMDLKREKQHAPW